MNEKQGLYTVAAETFDLVLIAVLDSPRPQVFRAKVERIYSTGKCITQDHLGAEIEFVGGPPTWGNVPLQVGERALMFVRALSGSFHEYPRCGHMVLEEIAGGTYTRLHVPEMWLRDDLPVDVRAAASPHPTWRNASIVRFSVLERYLSDLIGKAVR
ncbi:hypothetical protein BLA13014_02364 [Burkholderia aenigmatica]|uniref:Uncharacterized protein n=1 Tax=Burkholderia aenigmatica TaxID=2015348 RepID=A0A6P2KEU7_9BURK|nr:MULTISPECIES: hypothetical protein [Burkholderia]VWB53920.1 hypothetical protein BLA13014_02364 [Burkholderia aenigmatica]